MRRCKGGGRQYFLIFEKKNKKIFTCELSYFGREWTSIHLNCMMNKKRRVTQKANTYTRLHRR